MYILYVIEINYVCRRVRCCLALSLPLYRCDRLLATGDQGMRARVSSCTRVIQVQINRRSDTSSAFRLRLSLSLPLLSCVFTCVRHSLFVLTIRTLQQQQQLQEEDGGRDACV